MRKEHLRHLVCPHCKQDLILTETPSDVEIVESGTLFCSGCEARYPIVRFIPRFVPLENYASSFGLEWQIHARTQYDDQTGTNTSEKRFFEETRWSRDLSGETLLEVGSGSGRFTDIAVKTGAMVVSLDYSSAVEANYASNGGQANLLIVQGDIYQMPFREAYFDKLLCIGVLQHTPDVKKSFLSLPGYLKSGGKLVVDVYRKYTGLKGLLNTRYWVRPFTRRMQPEKLYALCERYVKLMWPLAKLIHKIPYIGKNINWALLISDYIGRYNFDDATLREWAILDSFDVLSPAYDSPQTLETLREWFQAAPLRDVEVQYGYNGIEGRGVKV
jgi:SAM-dependent methyltransferase